MYEYKNYVLKREVLYSIDKEFHAYLNSTFELFTELFIVNMNGFGLAANSVNRI